MTTRYRQLQAEERVTLASLRKQGHSLRAIAKVLQRSPSSLSREVARNSTTEGYASQAARQHAQARRTAGPCPSCMPRVLCGAWSRTC